MSTPLCLAPLLIHEDKLEFEVQNVFPADNVEKNRRHAKRQRAVQMLRVRLYSMPPGVLEELLPDPMQPSPK